MSSPLVSIIMPTRNRAQFIRDAIDSLLNQTYQNWELLVLDDASQDETQKIVKNYAVRDSRIKLLMNKIHMGTPRSRQILLEAARGEFIGHLDDDDFLREDAIEKIINEFLAHPDLSMVYSDYIMLNESKNFMQEIESADFIPENLVYLGFRPFTIYRKSAAIKAGGFNKNVFCEDGDLFMRIAKIFSCKRVPEFLYYYRSHDTNFGHTRPDCFSCEKKSACNFFEIWSDEYNKWENRQSTPTDI